MVVSGDGEVGRFARIGLRRRFRRDAIQVFRRTVSLRRTDATVAGASSPFAIRVGQSGRGATGFLEFAGPLARRRSGNLGFMRLRCAGLRVTRRRFEAAGLESGGSTADPFLRSAMSTSGKNQAAAGDRDEESDRFHADARARIAALAAEGKGRQALAESVAPLGIDLSKPERPQLIGVGDCIFVARLEAPGSTALQEKMREFEAMEDEQLRAERERLRAAAQSAPARAPHSIDNPHTLLWFAGNVLDRRSRRGKRR